MATIDSLEVIIETKAQDTEKSLNNIIKQMGLIAEGISAIGSNKGLNEFAKKAQEAVKEFSVIQNSVKNISSSATSEMKKVSKSFEEISAKYKDLGKGFKFVGSTSAIQKQIDSYANSLEKAKLKKDELEAGGKTGGQGYEDAIRDIQKYENIVESLKNQLAETQAVNSKSDLKTMNTENEVKSLQEYKSELQQLTGFLSSIKDVSAYTKGFFDIPTKNTKQSIEELKQSYPQATNVISSFEKMLQRLQEASSTLTKIPIKINVDTNSIEQAEQQASNFSGKWENIVNSLSGRLADLKSKEFFEYLSRGAKDYVKSAQVAAGIKIYTKDYKAILSDVERAENALNKFRQKKKEMRAAGISNESSEWEKITHKITEARNELGFYLNKKREMEVSGTDVQFSGGLANQSVLKSMGAVAGEAMSSVRQKIGEIGGAVSKAVGSIPVIGRVAKESAFIGKSAFEGLKFAISGILSVGKKISAVFSGLGKSFLGIGKNAKGMNASIAGGFKTVLKYAFGIRSLYMLLNKLRSAFSEGNKNLVQYSAEANHSVSMITSSLLVLKNALAVAFVPILNVIAPYVTAFINMMVSAANAVGRFFSSLTGKSFAVQAKEVFQDYAAGIEGAGKSAKKAGKDAKGALQPFDELNNITTNEPSGGGAGGAGGDGNKLSASDMFETVEVESSISNFAEKVREIFDVFRQAWESKGQSVINSAKSALESLGTSALSVGKTFYDVFTNGTGLTWLESSFDLLRSILDITKSISTAFSAAWNSGAGFENVTALFTMLTNVNGLLTSIGDSFSRAFSSETGVAIWGNILGIATGVFNTIGNFAKSIQTAWETAGLGNSIWQGILNIINIILGTIHNILDSTAKWAETLDFTPLLTSIDTLLKALESLTANIGAGLEWFWNNVLLPISTWAIQDAVPAFLDMVSAAIGSLNVIIEVFKPIGEWLWNEFLLPLGNWTGDLIISAMQTITNLLNTFTGALSENQGAASTLTGVIDGLSGAWSGISEILTPLAEFLSTVLADVWNNIITPALQLLGDTVLPKVTETFENLWNNVLVPFGSFLGDVLEPVIKIVSDVLTILWQNVVVPLANAIRNVLGKAFDGICKIFNKTVIPIVNSVIKVFQFLWKNVFSPIISFLNTTLQLVFSSVFESIGKIIDDLSKTFEGLIDFITGVFTGNWSEAWDGVKEIFSGIWNALKDVVKMPINAIIGFINGLVSGVVKGINGMTSALNKVSFNIPDWIPEIGGKKFGLNIPAISAPKIPYLAKGAVFKGGNPFLAVVNDQKRGQTNVETPLKVIQEALREELAKVSINFKSPEPNMKMLINQYEPTLASSYAGAYGNYRNDIAYTASGFNSGNSEMGNTIENAIYRATYNAVRSAIGSSKTLEDIKDGVQKGHVIQLESGAIAGEVRNIANSYTARTGRPWLAF